jgi:hypothetical protein
MGADWTEGGIWVGLARSSPGDPLCPFLEHHPGVICPAWVFSRFSLFGVGRSFGGLHS